MPNRVRTALALLWAAWAISLCVIIIHSVQFPGPILQDPGILGWPAALLQALLIYFAGRASNIARIVLAVLLVLAIPGVLVLESLIVAKLFLSACATGIGFVLRLAAIALLFTPAANRWFRYQKTPAASGVP